MDPDFDFEELHPRPVKCVSCDHRLSEDEDGPACADCEHSWRCFACETPMDNAQIAESMASYGDDMLAAAKAEEQHLLCDECRESARVFAAAILQEQEQSECNCSMDGDQADARECLAHGGGR